MRTKPMFPNHRWSGWPGAYRVYCGQPDAREQELADVGDGQETKCPMSDQFKMTVDKSMNPE